MKNAYRVTVQRGKKKRHFVVVKGPKPAIGDSCTIDGEDWEVVKTESTVAFAVDFPKARTRKVFP